MYSFFTSASAHSALCAAMVLQTTASCSCHLIGCEEVQSKVNVEEQVNHAFKPEPQAL
jgi:hypothetical protein